ncbi:MAG TPA: DNA-processing protein DprA [Stellaceae bacterium]|jgi:DNA processing protein
MSRKPLSPSERLDWLRLIRTDRVGPVTFHQLLARYGSAAAALDALPALVRQDGRPGGGGAAAAAIFPVDAARREIEALGRVGARLVAACEPDYPTALAAIEDAPPLIAILGDADLLNRPAVAVVGARNASANGRRIAREIAADLGRREIAVASGLARGIDAAAHAGALDSGTVAVVAGGVDIVYPEENRGLYDAIVERGGLVVAEAAVGTVPQARHFPRRNRIISGLSLGVVVVEAALRSGSLITARLALEQGREVFAVPGSPLDPRCRGTNDLIRNGARLTESAEDVLDVLHGPLGVRSPQPRAAGFPAPEHADEPAADGGGDPRAVVLERLGPSPVAVDELVRECHLSASAVLTVLLELELSGRLERFPGNQVALR